ncbi:MAG: TylF/MycF/NovP-related O-methyltransferase [Candidatus Altimarinota bacterium]|uniref:TylF/MycF/NovP-related O-methyltransferase n=1 Tax=Arcobacter sp. L TaxID=944547 RepID=UPI0002296693|nr:TylF/MycF/NovP-related O-methyltransferase [Arcobacter sp. L]BAK74561.1 dTDP-6-deoxy-L-hexose 3-O-methyltransferase [Arcobacter sp. L]
MILNNFDTTKMFEYENGFYATSTEARFGKLLSHYELYKKIINLPGDVVECGLFKGNSFFRFAHFRDLLESKNSRKIIGFDIFGKFPKTEYENDKKYLDNFISGAGESSIELDEIEKIMKYKNIENYEFVKGDINITLPKYCTENQHQKISLLHIDTDIYEPAVTILENMYERVVSGGIIIFDDYGTFPGETKAVDDFFKNKKEKIQKLSLGLTPSFIVKE